MPAFKHSRGQDLERSWICIFAQPGRSLSSRLSSHLNTYTSMLPVEQDGKWRLSAKMAHNEAGYVTFDCKKKKGALALKVP